MLKMTTIGRYARVQTSLLALLIIVCGKSSHAYIMSANMWDMNSDVICSVSKLRS